MTSRMVEVKDLGKRYRIRMPERVPETLREAAGQFLRAPFRYWAEMSRPPTESETLWALRHVDFELQTGEVLGVVGRNGAGKSTLLKVLSRITDPTEGRAVLRGRVGSLLEVGTGFHPELSGRENIYLSGTILGMSRREIDRKLDEIVAFSEIERFLDTPVKRYSSGMYVRLAFAVAAHLEPEILIVDEVLAVGDAAFQRKCLGRMAAIGHEGRTVLFVSHNMTAMQRLCARLIWLEAGQVVAEGDTEVVAAAYLKATLPPPSARTWSNPEPPAGEERVRLQAVRLQPRTSAAEDVIRIDTPLDVEIQFSNSIPEADLDIKLYVITESGTIAFVSTYNQSLGWNQTPLTPGDYRVACHIPGRLLNAAIYRLTIRITRNDSQEMARQDDVLAFEVGDLPQQRGYSYGKFVGAVQPELRWSLRALDGDPFQPSVLADHDWAPGAPIQSR